MKLILSLLLVTLALASDPLNLKAINTKLSTLEKRQNPVFCATITCVGPNALCSSTPCNACSGPFSTCLGSAQNATQICACYTSFSNCLRGLGSICDPVLESVFQNCPVGCCGAPVNASNTIPSCQAPYQCDYAGTGRCKAPATSGPCTSDQDCGLLNSTLFDNNQYACVTVNGSSQCELRKNNLAANDYCTTAADCVENIPCVGGRCQGKAVGAACTSSEACAFGLYCNSTGLCATQSTLGQNCADNNACPANAICGASGKCIAWYSVAAGANCSRNNDNECQRGLFCSQATRTCTTIPALGPCLIDANCTSGTTCGCNYVTGVRKCSTGAFDFPASCDTQYQTALNCFITNQCKGDVGANSCGGRFCANLINCFYACLVTDPAFRDNLVCQSLNFPCAGTPTSAAVPTSIGVTGTNGIPTSAAVPTSVGVTGTNGLSGTESSSASFVGISAAAFLSVTLAVLA